MRADAGLNELLGAIARTIVRVARLPHRRHQPLPAGVGRLRRHDRARERGGARGAARARARLRGLGARCSTSASTAAARSSCRTASSTGRPSARRQLTCPPLAPGDGADAWHPGGRALRADAPHRRPPARHPLRRRAASAGGGRPTRSSTCSSRSPTTRRSRCSRRRRPPRRRGTASRSSSCSTSRRACTAEPVDGRDPARGLRRRPRRARLPERPRGALRADEGRLEPRAAVGWSLDDVARGRRSSSRDVEACSTREFEIEGCYLLPADEAARRLAPRRDAVRLASRTAAARGRGTTTGCSCRCTTVAAR